MDAYFSDFSATATKQHLHDVVNKAYTDIALYRHRHLLHIWIERYR